MSTRKLAMIDYIAFNRQKLLAYWIHNQMVTHSIENYERVIAAFDAYGHEGVSMILAACDYETDILPVKQIRITEASEILKKIREGGDFRVFQVAFIKKDGTVRQMTCRYLVPNEEKKEGIAPNPHLEIVWDMEAEPRYSVAEQGALMEGKMEPKPKGAIKTINVSTLINMFIDGQQYVIEENKEHLSKLPN